jgi:hypothetical protein
MLDDPRDRLATMLAQLRDRSTWPPPPMRPLQPVSPEALVPADVVPIALDQRQDKAGQSRRHKARLWRLGYAFKRPVSRKLT